MDEFAIETHHLTKEFSRPGGFLRIARTHPTTAVNDVTLTVTDGELFGLLGPNGAGKTTLVKMLCTLIQPTGGSATIAGHPLRDGAAIRAEVGLVVTDERSFYWRLSGRHNLKFFAAMHKLYGAAAEARIDEVLAAVEMTEDADRRFSNYSSGMRQRMAIARSMLHRPGILFLDEPSRSLDPTATGRLHDLLRQLVATQGVTIFLITHDLAEAEALCGRVAVMHKGHIRTVGRPDDLRQRLNPRLHYTVRVDALPVETERAVQEILPEVVVVHPAGYTQISFHAGEADGTLSHVLDCLRGDGVAIHGIEGAPPTLEEVFAYYTSDRSARPGEG